MPPQTCLTDINYGRPSFVVVLRGGSSRQKERLESEGHTGEYQDGPSTDPDLFRKKTRQKGSTLSEIFPKEWFSVWRFDIVGVRVLGGSVERTRRTSSGLTLPVKFLSGVR